MQQYNQRRPFVILLMVVLVICAAIFTGYGVAWIMAGGPGGAFDVPASFDQGAERSTLLQAAETVTVLPMSETGAEISLPSPETQDQLAASMTPLIDPPPSTAPSLPPSATQTPMLTATAPPSPTSTALPPPPTLIPTVAVSPTPSVSIGVVRTQTAYIYDRPSDTASIIGGVEQDDELVVLGSRDTWYLVRIGETAASRSRIEGGQGWITADAMSAPSQPVPEITP